MHAQTMPHAHKGARIKDHPIFLMYWYGVCSIFSIVNYVKWVRFNETLLGRDLKSAYFAFVFLTTLVYLFATGVCFLWAAKYCDQETKEGIKQRNRRVHQGMLFIYFLSDTPFFIMDLYIVYWYGWRDEVQGITFVLKMMSWMVGTFFVWFIYMWKVSKILHKKTGADREIQLAGAPGTTLNIAGISNMSPDI
eukprot:Rhum_TRINITY_DN19189_c0_g1::Rhum_TRINITY_DN19189_c0_g1_i1::g.169489::m.169489